MTNVNVASIFNVVTNEGTSVTIRNEVDGQYVSAEDYGSLPLVANRDSPQGWEIYTLTSIGNLHSLLSHLVIFLIFLVRVGGSSYTIKSKANDKLVAVQSDLTLIANGGTTVSDSSTFTFTWL